MSLRGGVSGSVLLLVASIAFPVHADGGAAAEALFRAGREAARRGNQTEACAKFRESHRLDAALGTRLNLALCEEALGNLTTAWQLFQSLLSALPPEDARAELARRHHAALERRMPRILLRARGRLPPGLTVDGIGATIRESGFGVPIPVNPGRHEIDVAAPGYRSRRYSVVLEEGGSKTLDVALESRTPATQPPKAAPSRPRVDRDAAAEDSGGSLRVLGIVTLGVGGAALAVGIIAGSAAIRERDVMRDECDPDGCSAAGLAAARSGETFATLSTASFVAAVALAGAGTTLVLLPGQKDAPSSEARLGVVLAVGQVNVRGSF